MPISTIFIPMDSAYPNHIITLSMVSMCQNYAENVVIKLSMLSSFEGACILILKFLPIPNVDYPHFHHFGVLMNSIQPAQIKKIALLVDPLCQNYAGNVSHLPLHKC